MRFPFLASFIVFIVFFSLRLSKAKRDTEKMQKNFWDREAKANATRKKSLDNLAYIVIPVGSLPVTLLKDNEIVKECVEIINTLSTQKIVNFTGYTNTDLKLMYGAPNINLLMEYDQNYTLLARTLQKWAEILYKEGEISAAKDILEFAISTNTDVSGSYKLLASIYKETGETKKISALIQTAKKIRSSMKKVIIRTLQDMESGQES